MVAMLPGTLVSTRTAAITGPGMAHVVAQRYGVAKVPTRSGVETEIAGAARAVPILNMTCQEPTVEECKWDRICTLRVCADVKDMTAGIRPNCSYIATEAVLAALLLLVAIILVAPSTSFEVTTTCAG